MITHVAIRFRGQVWSLPSPYRHHHVMQVILFLQGDVKNIDSRGEDQGFLDSNGKYLTRQEALKVASDCEQLLPRATGHKLGELYSEDVW